MTISYLSAINAEVKVAEADVLRLSVGQAATVTLDALPGKRLRGTVIEIGAGALPPPVTAQATTAAREFRVVVRITDPVAGLRPGLTCDAEILTDERRDAIVVPLQSVVLRPPHRIWPIMDHIHPETSRRNFHIRSEAMAKVVHITNVMQTDMILVAAAWCFCSAGGGF